MTFLKYWLLLLCCLPTVFLSAQCDLVVDAGPDVTICGLGNTATLSGSVAGNLSNFQWTPAAGLSNPNGLSPTVSAPGVYTLTATGPSNVNLIANGDFEAGAGGFSSDYTFNPIPILNGTYTTVTSPQLVVSTFPPCDDHTFGNGTGQMLLVNGAGTPGENVWCQTVPVTPNTDYSLSAWVSTLVPIGLAQLQFSVNGQLLGGTVTPTSTPCDWVPFGATWNSGASTTATVCIVTQSTAGFGNDFVIDDIEMYGECQVSDQVVVTQLPEAEVNVQAVRCLGDCYFIGNTPYCSEGNYSQTLIGVNGCDSTVNLQLTVLEAVAFVLPPDTLSCYNDFTVTLDASFSTLSPFTVYNWSGPNGFSSSLQNPVISTPGTYTLEVVTSDAGTICSGTTSVTVIAQDNQPIADAGPDLTIGCGLTAAMLNGSIDNSNNQVVYAWSGPNGFSSEALSPEAEEAGVYVLEATDEESGCSSQDSMRLTLGGAALSAVLEADTLTCAQPLANLVATPDSAAIQVAWSGPNGFQDTLANTQVDAAGWYTFRQIDSTGCTGVDSVFVEVDTLPPTFSLSTAALSCNQPTDSLMAIGLSNYDTLWWSGPGGFSSEGETVQIDTQGLFLLQVIGNNGCASLDSVLVNGDFEPPGLATTGTTLDCGETEVFISASSIDTILAWSWSGPNGFTGSGDTIGVNATGSYIVTATGTNGCTAKDTTQVQAGQGLPQITASGATINCIQTEVMLIGAATNGASLQWSGPDGFTSSTSAPTVSTPGDYTLTASLGLNCTVDTTVSVLLDTLSPELLLQADTIDCSQTEATLNGSSSLPATYIWSGPGGYSSNMPAATATAPGWYTLNATADNGCSAQDSVLVVEDTTPPMIDVQGGTLSCDVTTLALQANSLAGALYEWSGPSGFASTEQQPAVSEAGLYILTLTGLNACSAVDTAVVLADTTTPSVQLLADTLTCAQQQVPINVVGAVPGLSYTWSGPDAFSSSLISPVVNQPGLYELQIEGINGCTAVDTAFVQADTLSPQLQLTSDTLTCAQTQIQIAVTADLSDLNYVWSGPNGFSSSLMQPFIETPGSYVLTAVASNGCSRTDSIRIVEDVALPQLQASGGALSCADTEVTLAGSSDGADDVLVWSGPGGFSQVADTVVTSQEGIYTLVATAANACQDSLQVSVPVDTVAPSISLAASNMLTCAMPEAVLQAEGVGEGYELIWSLGQNNLPATTDTAQVNAAGDYQLVAIDGSNGCADTAFLAVTIDTLSPQVFAEVIGNLDCLTDTVTLVGGSGGPVSFLWSTVDGLFGESPAQATTTATAPGDYLLTVEDSENGCQATDTVNVWENTAQPENIALAIFPPQCTSSTGSFRVLAVEGGTAPYLYALDDGPFAAIDSFGQLPPGTYELMVEDANGCRTSQSVLIPEPLPLTVALPMDIELGFSEAYQFNPVLNFPESIIASVNWSPADYLSCTDCLRPLAEQAREDIVYTLTIETDQGCTVSAQLSVKVLQERSIYVPNAFSPGNADGRNDYFTVYASANEVARIKRLAVFDRWGAQVFERQDFPPSEPSQGWDGGYRGEKAPSGTYVYWLEVEFVDGKTLLQKGELMLLR